MHAGGHRFESGILHQASRQKLSRSASERLSLWLELAHHSLWRRRDKSSEESSLKTEYLVNLAAIVVGSLELGNEGGRIWVTTFAQMR